MIDPKCAATLNVSEKANSGVVSPLWFSFGFYDTALQSDLSVGYNDNKTLAIRVPCQYPSILNSSTRSIDDNDNKNI